ncbi:MAG: hypothetical protein ACHP6I_00340 [Rickettsiales bacterium]
MLTKKQTEHIRATKAYLDYNGDKGANTLDSEGHNELRTRLAHALEIYAIKDKAGMETKLFLIKEAGPEAKDRYIDSLKADYLTENALAEKAAGPTDRDKRLEELKKQYVKTFGMEYVPTPEARTSDGPVSKNKVSTTLDGTEQNPNKLQQRDLTRN